MDENDVATISANKELKLAECRVRCVIENAKCIRKASSAPKNKNKNKNLFLAKLFQKHETCEHFIIYVCRWPRSLGRLAGISGAT